MLKIREDIDLKELEKFYCKGLKCMIPEDEDDFHLKYENVYTDKKCIYSTDDEDLVGEIDIMEDGEIRVDSVNVELIYDLIQAGLVEKLEEK